jgi:hypothetical protein
MKNECFSVNAVPKHPRVPASASCEPGLLILHAALNIEELWQAVTKSLRAALAVYNCSMSLSPSENGPGVLRVSNRVADLKLYAAKIEAMAPVYAVFHKLEVNCRGKLAVLLRLAVV